MLKFGNQGALFMRAMTWWDHKTQSIWSQPWGSAIAGPLKDHALTLIPASIVPWSTWLAGHPDTTVLGNDLEFGRYRVQTSTDDFVIGVALEDNATAYHYEDASGLRIINDKVGTHPIVVFVDPDTREINVFLRRIREAGAYDSGPSELVFALGGDGQVTDIETGSKWDTKLGAAIEGSLKGTVLQQIPYITSFDWAWEDFFPHTSFYETEG